LDCGAGIGRVTKFVLQDKFDTIDFVEPAENLLREVPKHVKEEKIGKLFCQGLEEFKFDQEYDCIWV